MTRKKERNESNLLQAPISTLQAVMHRLSREKGWWPQLDDKNSSPAEKKKLVEATIPEKLVLIHSEVSEAMEEYRRRKRITEVSFGEDDEEEKPEGLPIELADVVIRVFDLAEALHIDLGYWIVRKYEYNQTRKKRHGGKRA